MLSTVKRKTFEGENFHEFHGFVAIRKSFLWGVASFGMAKVGNLRKSSFHQFVKVFSLESFPLYSIQCVVHVTFHPYNPAE